MYLLYLSLMLAYDDVGINHASNLCGSYIMSSHPSVKNGNKILNSNDDSYMVGYRTPSYIVIKLCNEVRINIINIKNNEWLSSFPSKVRFSILDNKKWITIGTFTIKKSRKQQKFIINNNRFSNILAIQILSSEGQYNFYTLTKIEVYGKTLLEDFRLNVKDNNLYELFSPKAETIDKYTGHENMDLHMKIKELEEKTKKMAMGIIAGIILIGFFITLKIRTW